MLDKTGRRNRTEPRCSNSRGDLLGPSGSVLNLRLVAVTRTSAGTQNVPPAGT